MCGGAKSFSLQTKLRLGCVEVELGGGGGHIYPPREIGLICNIFRSESSSITRMNDNSSKMDAIKKYYLDRDIVPNLL